MSIYIPSSLPTSNSSDVTAQLNAKYNKSGGLISGNVDIAGTLDISSLTNNQLIVSNSSDTLISQVLTDGQLIIGNTSTSSYIATSITAGTNIIVTNGHGSIKLDISTTPEFSSATFDNLNTYQIVSSDGSKGLISQNLTDGQLLIGNSFTTSYNASSLTSGVSGNISITNGHGSITLDIVTIPTFSEVIITEILSFPSGSYTGYISGPLSGNSSLTLPSSNGSNNQVLTTDGSGHLFFRGNNIITATDSTFVQVATSAGSYVTTSTTATITLSAITSKVLIMISGQMGCSSGGEGFCTIYRGSTDLSSGAGFNATVNPIGPCCMTYLDSPASIAALTYTVYIKELITGYVFWNSSAIVSTITLQEIF